MNGNGWAKLSAGQGNFSFPSTHEAKAFGFDLFFSCLKLNPKDLATL